MYTIILLSCWCCEMLVHGTSMYIHYKKVWLERNATHGLINVVLLYSRLKASHPNNDYLFGFISKEDFYAMRSKVSLELHSIFVIESCWKLSFHWATL